MVKVESVAKMIKDVGMTEELLDVCLDRSGVDCYHPEGSQRTNMHLYAMYAISIFMQCNGANKETA